jgi:hypothetical protein
LLGVTAFFAIAYVIYDLFAERVRLYPSQTLISETWFGPYVLMLIPTSFGWMCLAAKRLWARILGLTVALLLFVYCLNISGIVGPPGGVY